MSEETFDRLCMQPNGWLEKTINDITIRVGSGVTPTGGSEVYSDSGVIFVRSQNVTNSGLLLDDVAFIDTLTHEKMRSSELLPFDVLLNITGASIGRCCVFPQEIGSANVNQHVCTIRLKSPNYMEAKFLALLFVSPLGQNQIFRLNAGGNREGLNYQQIRSMCFSFPPLPQQRKIAKILTTVDNLIEKTESLIAKYQSIKQGMMHDLFTRGVDSKGKIRPPQSEAPELYKQSELGWIPKEWEVETINALAVRVGSGITPTGGSEVYQNEGVIFIRSQNVTYEGLDLSDVAFIEIKTHQLMSNSEVYSFDVLLNITGASIGRCCYLPDGLGRTNTNQHVCCIRLNNSNEGDAKFLSSIIGSPIGQIQIYCLNAGGNREGLNYQQLRSFIIPWANIRERHEIANLLMSIESKISRETQFLIKLRSQKTALMQDLLTGNVQVTPDQEDKELAHA